MSTQGSDILQARSFVHALIQRFWQIKLSEAGFSESFPIRALFERSSSPVQITQQEQLEVQSLSDTLSKLNLIESSFKIGEIYTAKLPKEYRAQYGIYFTPPALTSRPLRYHPL